MKIMKRFFALLLITFVVWICAFPTLAVSSIENTNKVLLSSLSYEECVEFLKNSGIVIPSNLKNVNVKNLIKSIENNPHQSFGINWDVLAEFCENVRTVVNDYYGNTMLLSLFSSNYTLQYSTVYADYAGVGLFNCYAYVLGITTHRCYLGDLSGNTYTGAETIGEITDMVIEDLRSTNLRDDLNRINIYNCIKQQDTRPSSLGIWENVIAARKDLQSTEYGNYDYHFAKLSNGDWLHKPDNSAILKFNESPTNAIAWTNERFYNHVALEHTITYESSIKYILYKTDHDEYVRTGQHYHSGNYHYFEYNFDCSDCGVEGTTWIRYECDGPPCAIIASIEGTPITE